MQRHLLRAGFLFLGTLCCANVLAGENIATTAVDVKPASEIKVVFHPTVILSKAREGASADQSHDCKFYQYENKLHSFLVYKDGDSIRARYLAWEGYDLSKHTVTVNGVNVPVSSLPVERSSHRVYRPGGAGESTFEECQHYGLRKQTDWFDYSY